MSVPDAQRAPEVNLEVRPNLPRLILIADRFTDLDVAQRVLDAVPAGVPWVHLRDNAAEEDVFRATARDLVSAIRDIVPDVLISINGRIAVARELCTGFHTGARGPSIQEARSVLGGPLGYSAHTFEEAHSAVGAGAEYLIFSPIFPTISKPGQPGVGLDRLRALTEEVREAPVYALGGITPERVGGCIEVGAYGVAVLGGILHAEDSATAVRAYLEVLFTHEV